jgi:ADP-heptose:LPS heptosyltransferase
MKLLHDIKHSIKLLYFLLSKDTIFVRRFSNGMGDNLLLTGLLPELRKRNPNKKIVVESTRWCSLFENNPYVDWVTHKHFKTTKRHTKPKYHIDTNTNRSLYSQLGDRFNFEGEYYPELYISQQESDKIRTRFLTEIRKPIIITCPLGKRGYSANRKEWGFDNFQKLVNMTSSEYQWLQIGVTKDKLLDNVIDARGLDIRESATLVKEADLLVSLEGGLMHIAKAVNTPAVVIYGGVINPTVSGYKENINIYNGVECSPCFRSDKALEDCSHMKCMKIITPELVNHKIKQKIR